MFDKKMFLMMHGSDQLIQSNQSVDGEKKWRLIEKRNVFVYFGKFHIV